MYDTLTLLVNGKPVFMVEGSSIDTATEAFIKTMNANAYKIVDNGLKNDDMDRIPKIRTTSGG